MMTTEERFNEIGKTFAPVNLALSEVSGDRLICDEPEDGLAGAVSVRVGTWPHGVNQWTTSGPAPTVLLTRQSSGEVTQHMAKLGHPVAVTDAQVATEFGVGLDVWAAGRVAIQAGLAEVAGVTATELAPRVVTDLDLYHTARSLDREDPAAALMFGVEGNDASARRVRLAQAVAVRESWHAVADAAYTHAVGQEEPYVPQPFGLGAVIRAEGDLEQALHDHEVHWQLAERLNLNGSFVWVHDEDGQREVHRTSRADTAEGRREIEEELRRIARQVGVAEIVVNDVVCADDPRQLSRAIATGVPRMNRVQGSTVAMQAALNSTQRGVASASNAGVELKHSALAPNGPTPRDGSPGR